MTSRFRSHAGAQPLPQRSACVTTRYCGRARLDSRHTHELPESWALPLLALALLVSWLALVAWSDLERLTPDASVASSTEVVR